MKFQDIELKHFFDLSHEEKLMILDWRNDINVRKWMYSSEIVLEKNHLNFIESLKKNDAKQYFSVFKDGKIIGVVYFTKINKEKNKCEFGLYANPFLKTVGTGSLLMETGVRYAYDFLKMTKLKLEVFEENLRAQSLYKKYGFKEMAEKYVNERKVICMELVKDVVK